MAKCNISCLYVFLFRMKRLFVLSLHSLTHSPSVACCNSRRKTQRSMEKQKGRILTVQAATSAYKTQRKINQNTFKYTTSVERYRTIFRSRESNHLPYIPETYLLPRQLLGKYCSNRSQVYPPYSKYIMLITWFWEEPIRHDLHLKTAFNYVKPQGMCVLKSVNKYRSEGGEEMDGVSYKKNQVFETTGNLQSPATLYSFGFLLLPADLLPPPLPVL